MIKRTRLVLLCLAAAAALALPAGIGVAASAGGGSTDPATPDAAEQTADLRAELEQAAEEDPILPKGAEVAPGKRFEVTLNGKEKRVNIIEDGETVNPADPEAIYVEVLESQDPHEALTSVNMHLRATEAQMVMTERYGSNDARDWYAGLCSDDVVPEILRIGQQLLQASGTCDRIADLGGSR